MGSLPNMDVCSDNIVISKRTRSRTERYVHPDEYKVNMSVYREEEMDEEAEAAGEQFVPINADCVESGEDESDGMSDTGGQHVVSDDEVDSGSGSYVPLSASESSECESSDEF